MRHWVPVHSASHCRFNKNKLEEVIVKKKFRPALFTELKIYYGKKLGSDLFCGITVGVVALPLAMAFSIASGFLLSVGYTRR